eukprot:CAMPEP_0195087826 /NCGR_PEP_ID=MMETSP0448-20130528/27560_1 /TAXON_ID=66468 /ORGANISM="Heterocapsa triquestra, Strain CCMP 448" /LENGTH=103 /DNA_ID=CAMNT_0040121419 /DNA_START=86 /DNA_END=394 /DNA_ORIENTATION=-
MASKRAAEPTPAAAQEEDEELEDMPEAEKEKDPLHKARICREVGGETFRGEVEDMEVGSVSREVLYRIRYDDGDLEHYTADMVRKYLDTKAPAAVKRPAAAEA